MELIISFISAIFVYIYVNKKLTVYENILIILKYIRMSESESVQRYLAEFITTLDLKLDKNKDQFNEKLDHKFTLLDNKFDDFKIEIVKEVLNHKNDTDNKIHDFKTDITACIEDGNKKFMNSVNTLTLKYKLARLRTTLIASGFSLLVSGIISTLVFVLIKYIVK